MSAKFIYWEVSLLFAFSLSFITVKRVHATFLGKAVSVPGLQAFRCPLDSGGSRGGAREARPPYF